MLRLKNHWLSALLIGLFFVVEFALTQAACAQDRSVVKIPNPKDSAVGLTSEQVAELDQWIEQTRQTWQVPGLSVAIVRDEKVLLCKGYGVCELGKPEAVDDQTLFAIDGSL